MRSGSLPVAGDNFQNIVLGSLFFPEMLSMSLVFQATMAAQACVTYVQDFFKKIKNEETRKRIVAAQKFMELVGQYGLMRFLPDSYKSIPTESGDSWIYTDETLWNPEFAPSPSLFKTLYMEKSTVRNIPPALSDIYGVFKQIAERGRSDHSRRIGFALLRMTDKIIEEGKRGDNNINWLHVSEAMRRMHKLLNDLLKKHEGVTFFSQASDLFLRTGEDFSTVRKWWSHNRMLVPGNITPLTLLEHAAAESDKWFYDTIDAPSHIKNTAATLKESAQALLVAAAHVHGLTNRKFMSYRPEEIEEFMFDNREKTKLYRYFWERVRKDTETVTTEKMAADLYLKAGNKLDDCREFSNFLAAVYVVMRQVTFQESIVEIINISGTLSISEILPIFNESFSAFLEQIPVIVENIAPVFNSDGKVSKIDDPDGMQFAAFRGMLESVYQQARELGVSSFYQRHTGSGYLRELKDRVSRVRFHVGQNLSPKNSIFLESQIIIAHKRLGIQVDGVVVPTFEEKVEPPEDLSAFLDPENDPFCRVFVDLAQGIRERLQDGYMGPGAGQRSAFQNAINSWRAHLLWKNTDEAHAAATDIDAQLDRLMVLFNGVMDQFVTAVKTASPDSLPAECPVLDLLSEESYPKALQTCIRNVNYVFSQFTDSLNACLAVDRERIREIATAHRDYLRLKRDFQCSLGAVLHDNYAQNSASLEAKVIQSLETSRPAFTTAREALVSVVGELDFKQDVPEVEASFQANSFFRQADAAIIRQREATTSPAARLSWWGKTGSKDEPLCLAVRQNQATVDFIYTLVNGLSVNDGWDTDRKQSFLRQMLAGEEVDVTIRLTLFREALMKNDTAIWLMSLGLWTGGDLMMRFKEVSLPLNILVEGEGPLSIRPSAPQRSLLSRMCSSEGNAKRRESHFGRHYGLFAYQSYRQLQIENLKQSGQWSPDQQQMLAMSAP